MSEMGMLNEDTVLISQPEKIGDPIVITVNCPDKTGLGCDLCRIMLLFGLSISKGDVVTDGKWCYIMFWVVGRPTTNWNLLKKRLLEVCPSYLSASGIDYYSSDGQQSTPPDVFLLKLWCSYDRKGLLHDVTEVLWQLELTIKRVKISTTPDGRKMHLFFVTDTRNLLHTTKRQDEAMLYLKNVFGDNYISCDIRLTGVDITACSYGSLRLPSGITEDIFNLEAPKGYQSRHLASYPLSIKVDNNLSPSHTLIQILCLDHKGLLYDIMRTLKDYNIQVSYGRFYAKAKGNCEVDLFITQADGRKIIDPEKKNALCSRLKMELSCPLRVAVGNRGPDIELLVANPVELSSRGRPLVFYDVARALKILNINIFSVEIGRHMIKDREWEVYKILIDETDGFSIPRNKIEDGVRNTLMSWEFGR